MSESSDHLGPEKFLSSYRGGKSLGSGTQGHVFRYTYRPTNTQYAVKVITYNPGDYEETSASDPSYVVRERVTVDRFVHPHLLKAHAIYPYSDGVAIIMPYFEQGSLASHVKPNLQDLKLVVCQTLEALVYLHKEDFTHRDINPKNILIRNAPGQPLDIVVSDYGLISWKNTVSVVGTRSYMAPEIWKNETLRQGEEPKDYGHPVDIYALGILILWAFNMEIPRYAIKTYPVHKRRIMGQVDRELAKCESEDTERRGALLATKAMLKFNPKSRPTAEQCLRHPWLCATQTDVPMNECPLTPTDAPTLSSLVRSATVAKPMDNWWDSSLEPPKPRFNLRSRHPKKPIEHTLTKNRNKIQKASQNSLPTPRLTPAAKQRDVRSEGGVHQVTPSPEGFDRLSPHIGSDRSYEEGIGSDIPSNWYDVDMSG